MNQAQKRLFIALPVDDEAALKSLSTFYSGLDRFGRELKTVERGNLHITLKFLGNVDGTKSLEIAGSFPSLAKREKISYILKGVGCFPSISSPSVIWAGVECDMLKMSSLFGDVESFCSSHGFEREKRKFIPHLTIARVRREKSISPGLKSCIKSFSEHLFAESVFDRLVLFESLLKKDGPEYEKLSEVILY